MIRFDYKQKDRKNAGEVKHRRKEEKIEVGHAEPEDIFEDALDVFSEGLGKDPLTCKFGWTEEKIGKFVTHAGLDAGDNADGNGSKDKDVANIFQDLVPLVRELFKRGEVKHHVLQDIASEFLKRCEKFTIGTDVVPDLKDCIKLFNEFQNASPAATTEMEDGILSEVVAVWKNAKKAKSDLETLLVEEKKKQEAMKAALDEVNQFIADAQELSDC